MIKRILIVGGASGIGLSIAMEMVTREKTQKVYIVDKAPFPKELSHNKIESFQFDLAREDYAFFDRFDDIDSMMITAGFGRLSRFKDIPEQYIIDSFNVNAIPVIRLIKRFYHRIDGPSDFYCGVMDSIAGWMSSPLLAVYAATKAAIKVFIESVNVELLKDGSQNCILNVSPGSIKGTSFNGGKTDIQLTKSLAQDIIYHLERKDDLFIPQYEDVFKDVLERYHADFRREGQHSYEYKMNSGRLKE